MAVAEWREQGRASRTEAPTGTRRPPTDSDTFSYIYI